MCSRMRMSSTTFLYPIEDDAEFAEIARVFEDRLQDLFEIDLEDEE